MCLEKERVLEVVLSGSRQMIFLAEGFAQRNWRVEKKNMQINYKKKFLVDCIWNFHYYITHKNA